MTQLEYLKSALRHYRRQLDIIQEQTMYTPELARAADEVVNSIKEVKQLIQEEEQKE